MFLFILSAEISDWLEDWIMEWWENKFMNFRKCCYSYVPKKGRKKPDDGIYH